MPMKYLEKLLDNINQYIWFYSWVSDKIYLYNQ